MHANTSPVPHTEVHFRVDADADAVRITAVLEALGYHVVRQLDELDGHARLRWAVDRLSRVHRLTDRETEVLAGVLAGHANEALARRLKISRATIKWHLHNVFAKVGVGSREALLRTALELGGEAGEWHRAGPNEVTVKL